MIGFLYHGTFNDFNEWIDFVDFKLDVDLVTWEYIDPVPMLCVGVFLPWFILKSRTRLYNFKWTTIVIIDVVCKESTMF